MKNIVLLPTLIALLLSVCKAEDKYFDTLPTVTDTIRFNNFEYSFEKNFVWKGYKHQKRQQDTSYHPNWYFECVEKKEGYVEAYLYSKPEAKSLIKIYFYPKDADNDSLRIDIAFTGDTNSFKNVKSEHYDNLHIQKIASDYSERSLSDDIGRAWITKSDKDFYIVLVLYSNSFDDFDKNLYHLCKTANSLRQINDTFSINSTVDMTKETNSGQYSKLLHLAFKTDDQDLLEKYLDLLASKYKSIDESILFKKPHFEREAYKLYEEFFYPEVERNDSIPVHKSMSYNIFKHFFLQNKLDVTIVEDIDLTPPSENYKLYHVIQNKIHDTLSNLSINDFHPRLKNETRKLIYLDDGINEYLTAFVKTEHWDQSYSRNNPYLFDISYHRAEFLQRSLFIFYHPHTLEWIIGGRPILNIVLNKKFDKAVIFSRFWYKVRIDLLIKEKGIWKLVYSDTWASIP